MNLRFYILITLALTPIGLAADTVFVYDRSGSMGDAVENVRKIDIARAALSATFAWAPVDRGLGFLSFPSDDGCGVSQEIPVNRNADARLDLEAAVRRIEPNGSTPLALAIDRAGALFQPQPGAASHRIIVITDGLETCDGDPVAAAAKWRNAGLNIVIHIISFAVEENLQQQLRLTAQAGGGVYQNVDTGADLGWLLVGLMRWQGGDKCETIRSGDFVDAGDGFVYNRGAGQVWQKCAPGQKFELCNCRGDDQQAVMNWSDAGKYCAALRDGGRRWRLPTIDELQTVIERKKQAPYLNQTLFPSGGDHRYWSGSEYGAGMRMVYDYRLGEGDMIDEGVSRVRCVAE